MTRLTRNDREDSSSPAHVWKRFIGWARRPLGATVLALAVGGVAVAVALAARAGREPAEPPPSTASMAEMQGMEMSGMDMSADGSVRLTPDQLGQFGVTFDSAEERMLEKEVRTVGIVRFDETRMAQVAPKVSGFVERLYVDFTGQPVRARQPLVEIYSPDLVTAQEELLLAARLDASLGASSVPGVSGSASDLAQLARRRLQLWDISDAQINEIVETGRVRRTLTLHAPVSGIVVEKSVMQGQAVQAGQTLYTIADLDEVWVEAELREADAGAIQEGATATVEFTAFPGRPILGTVEYVYPTLQREARTLRARIALPNPDGRIRPGMYATMRLASPSRRALTLPTSAVIDTGERSVVFVDLGAGRLMPQEVETGGVGGEYTEILAGIEPGQRVVTSAQYLLDSESNMAEIMRSMIGMMGSGDMGQIDMGGMDMSGGSMEGMEMNGADLPAMPAVPTRER